MQKVFVLLTTNKFDPDPNLYCVKEPFRVKVSNQVVVFSGIQVDASLKNKRPIMKEKKNKQTKKNESNKIF